ncbi:Hypothetical protein HDN1F_11010 [gamma proteobacterium HdN1]|nr:Hypothetical protein HDN1F_11010 [gamma proteobacterium HdN1]
MVRLMGNTSTRKHSFARKPKSIGDERHPFALRPAFLIVATALSATLNASLAHADSFDDAVNHYKKGFSACQQASKELQENKVDTAKAKIAEYQRYFQEAQAIDKSIAYSTERDMKGNIEICKRIQMEISNREGEPILERALTQCHSAEKALEDGDPATAETHLKEFRSLRDDALARSPGLTRSFANKSQISKCDRLEAKVKKADSEQKAEHAATEAAKTAALQYTQECEGALKTLQTANAGDAEIRSANQQLAKAAGFKKSASNNAAATKVFSKQPNHPDKATIENHLKNGDACVANAHKQVAAITARIAEAKKAEQEKIEREKAERAALAAAAAKEKAEKEQAERAKLEAAKKAKENELRIAAEKAAAEKAAADKAIAEKNAAAVAAAASAAATAASKAVQVTANSQPASTAPSTKSSGTGNYQALTASVTLSGIHPDFLLFYVIDGSSASNYHEAIFDRNGFDKPVYVVRPNATLSIRNNDNALHRFSTNLPHEAAKGSALTIGTWQKKSLNASWPVNTAAQLKSAKATIAGTWIVTLDSGNFQTKTLTNGSANFSLEGKQITQGGVIIPGLAPIKLQIDANGNARSDIVVNGKKLGEITIGGQ